MRPGRNRGSQRERRGQVTVVGPVMLGLVLGFRGGVPTNASDKDPFEGVFFFAFEIGGGFVR